MALSGSSPVNHQAAGHRNSLYRMQVGWGRSPMGNDKHVYACHKVTGMLFVATAELRWVAQISDRG